MTNALLIAKRDLRAYAHGYSAWLIIAGLLALQGVFFAAFAMDGERYSHEVLRDFFYFNWGFAVAASVLLTMRSVAEERRDGTDVLLTTSTATDGQMVLGKWLAAMGVLVLFTLLSGYLPALIYVNGKVSMAHLAVGYLGVLATVSATSAIGICSSSLFRFQLAAGLLTAMMVVTLIVAWILADITDPPFANIIAYSALYNQHYEPFSEGRLSISGLTYYGSLTAAFLLLATRINEGRRWE
jgi:ABC-2 type transport system permease protein